MANGWVIQTDYCEIFIFFFNTEEFFVLSNFLIIIAKLWILLNVCIQIVIIFWTILPNSYYIYLLVSKLIACYYGVTYYWNCPFKMIIEITNINFKLKKICLYLTLKLLWDVNEQQIRLQCRRCSLLYILPGHIDLIVSY